MVKKGGYSTRDRAGLLFGVKPGQQSRNTSNPQPRSNGGPKLSGSVLQSSNDKIIGHLKNAGINAASPLASKIMNSIPHANTVAGAYKMLPPEHRAAVKEAVMGVFKGQPIIPTKGDSVMNSSYGLSKAPNPKPVALNSGIAPNCYANDYMTPTLGVCSPMHINCGTLAIPTSTGNSVSTYFLNTVAFDIQTRAQTNVNFALDLTKLSTANIVGGLNAAIYGLQTYFYYTSILSYESDPRNKNAAMIALRAGLTPQIIADVYQLGRRLEDTPIPPRVVEWVRYMSMNFLSGNSQGSPLLKLVPYPRMLDNSLNYPQDSLSLLGNYNETYALIRRAIPQWTVKKLYDVPTTPVFDKNFLTIFANLPSLIYNGTVENYVPAVAGAVVSTITSTPIAYNSYSNKLDGLAYAMGGICGSQNGVWYPGLVTAQSFANGSRLSWYTNGTTASWTTPSASTFVNYARQETINTPTQTTTSSQHLFGAERCLGVTGDAMMQSARNALDFLFNIDSIPVRGKLSHFNENSK